MSFIRENTIMPGVGEDTVKQAILKLDDDIGNLFNHVNVVNVYASQKISLSEKGAANGTATLDSSSKIPVDRKSVV